MELSELKGKTPDQLEAQLLELKKEAFNLRFQKLSGALQNTARVRVVRRTIARINTLLNQPIDAQSKPARVKAVAKPKSSKKAKEAASA